MRKKSLRSSWTVCLVAIAATASFLSADPAGAVAGDAVETGQYAFTVKLDIDIDNGKRSCSGALVDPVWVLTAASCFAGADGTVPAGELDTFSTVVMAGGPPVSPYAVYAKSLVPHPSRDLAMVRLLTPLPHQIRPVFEAEPIAVASTPVSAGEKVRVTGYGRTKTEWVTDAAHTATPVLSAVDTTSLSLVGTAPESVGICKGDTGGPTFRLRNDGQPELVGIHSRSWGAGCFNSDETRDGAVDTRVDNVSAWIRSIRMTNVARLTSQTYTTADFNGDGRTDVAAVLLDGRLHALYTGADGTLEYGRPLWKDESWANATKIVGGDFNGDGNGDIAAMWSDGQLYFYAGTADGTLRARVPMWHDTSWKTFKHIARYKVDDSGRDGLIGVSGGGSLYAYASGPDGVLTGAKQSMWPDSTWGGKTHFTTADYNGDGRDDIAAVSTTRGLDLYTGNASSSFDKARSMSTNADWTAMDTIAGGEFNGDGKGDLTGNWHITTSPEVWALRDFQLYLGDGKGALSSGSTLWPAGS
ncbi:trypsin-like serine protease [Streptomyces sp. 130]|uniref:trypsin-like serine protease n=1 Tax=Streptomyces sp. 130 TaxID=2591006 RepID=UPI00117E8314|nr:trypsin-like serine protease [Streptomyces sp. 130]TRV76834.1 trypsin-like serine protease [Streptomyces sp. 130]